MTINEQQIKEFLLRVWERTLDMFHTAADEGHGNVILIFVIGMVFGSILQYTKVHKFEKIAGFSMLKDTVVPKMLFLAIGLASIGLYYMVEAGYASYHIKTINLFGIIIGGTIFGIAMAIFGKCPGTGPISVAEGRIDIMVGSIGGILGGLVFTVYYDYFQMIMGPDLGKLSVINDFNFGDSPKTILIFGGAIILVSILIPLREEVDEKDPAYAQMIQKLEDEKQEEEELEDAELKALPESIEQEAQEFTKNEEASTTVDNEIQEIKSTANEPTKNEKETAKEEETNKTSQESTNEIASNPTKEENSLEETKQPSNEENSKEETSTNKETKAQ
jgi:hypothetical protein